MLEEKKKEIVKFFIEKGILIDADFLEKIKNIDNLEEVYSLLSEKLKSNKTFILNNDIKKETKQIEERPENKVRVLFSYDEYEKKVEVQDFINFFNARYEALKLILQNRQEMQNITSINKLFNKKDKSNVSIIGMVSDKQITKNGNVMLILEDPTGQIKVLVNKSKPDLIEITKNIVYDEVIGVVGVNGQDVLFANNIIQPDIPLNKELKKSEKESYAVFLSDIHIGSKYFLAEEFSKFLKWINCETGNENQKEIASKVDYIFITGDLVDGVGIYPEQDNELIIKDIYEQYKECAELLKKIPERIKIIVCPGNHDAMRISEPQPKLYKDFAEAIWKLPNVINVSNPAIVNIGSDENFPGFDVLMYHGYSFDHYVSEVDSIRINGGYDRADLIMKFLLQKRHLAPTHTSTLYLPNQKKDNLVISTIPDFFVTGHIHKSAVKNYRNITMICGSCWQSKTSFQEKVGHNPEPCKVPIVNLKTREVKILNFGK